MFSFIQKFFPDFFPSTFTERRQSVMRIYRDIVPEENTLWPPVFSMQRSLEADVVLVFP